MRKGKCFSYLKEDTKRRKDDGKNDLADVAGGGQLLVVEMALSTVAPWRPDVEVFLPCLESHCEVDLYRDGN